MLLGLTLRQGLTTRAFAWIFLTLAFCSMAHADWPRFLNSGFDGQASPAADLGDDPEFRLAWSLEVGEGYGLGSIAQGTYYHFDAIADPDAVSGRSGEIQERLRAIDVATGTLAWSKTMPTKYRDLFGYEAGPRSTPSITMTDGKPDQIYTMGVTGVLACRDASDGTLRWSVDTNQDYGVVQNFFGVGTSPLCYNELVIVMVGGSPAEDAKVAPMRLNRVSPNGSALVALDRLTGKEVWRCGNDLASYSSPRLITIDDQAYVLAFARDGVLMVDPREGKQLWRFDHRAEILESVNAIVPIVRGDEVFVSECYNVGSALLRVSANSANVIWQDPLGNRRKQAMRSHWATPVLIDGFLYGCSGRNAPDSDFRCVEWHTGKLHWKDERRIRSSVTRVSDKLLVLEERGLLQVIAPNPDELSVIAELDLSQADGDRPALKSPCWAAPVVDGNRVLLRGDMKVLCLQW